MHRNHNTTIIGNREKKKMSTYESQNFAFTWGVFSLVFTEKEYFFPTQCTRLLFFLFNIVLHFIMPYFWMYMYAFVYVSVDMTRDGDIFLYVWLLCTFYIFLVFFGLLFVIFCFFIVKYYMIIYALCMLRISFPKRAVYIRNSMKCYGLIFCL